MIQEGEFTDSYFRRKDWWRDLTEVTGASVVEGMPEGNVEQALLEAEDDAYDAQAAITARKELTMDDDDFRDSPSRATSVAPAESTPTTPTTPAHTRTASAETRRSETPQPTEAYAEAEEEKKDEDEDEDEEGVDTSDMHSVPGHVDAYMLRFWEREMGVYLGFGGFPPPPDED